MAQNLTNKMLKSNIQIFSNQIMKVFKPSYKFMKTHANSHNDKRKKPSPTKIASSSHRTV